ncbi:hypothetical protein [Aquimarina sp. 2201CG5-10]|uniref:hypothetical protein n=1 Tax=Aquimarina callyspongiae TaxID=3098150 RepID=UPI002AB47588|nr:hypothetical protein [Aquimarina sp. 2201CG5-10]MDY8134571.1 hypothetical protein [Aquimarina sp. 2201CG5-10]
MKKILHLNGVKKLSRDQQKSVKGASEDGCHQVRHLCCENGNCGLGECHHGRFCLWW